MFNLKQRSPCNFGEPSVVSKTPTTSPLFTLLNKIWVSFLETFSHGTILDIALVLLHPFDPGRLHSKLAWRVFYSLSIQQNLYYAAQILG